MVKTFSLIPELLSDQDIYDGLANIKTVDSSIRDTFPTIWHLSSVTSAHRTRAQEASSVGRTKVVASVCSVEQYRVLIFYTTLALYNTAMEPGEV